MSSKRHYLSNAYEYFNTLTMVFYLMVSIPLVFFVLVYLQYEEQGGLGVADGFYILPHLVLPLVIAASIYLAYKFYNQKLEARQAEQFREKLKAFHQLSLYKYGFLSLANFLAVIGLYFTGEQLYAGIYAIALVFFSFHRPTHQRVSKDLKLSDEEQDLLRSDKNFDEL